MEVRQNHQNHFSTFQNFKPDENRSFADEFDALASSQGWNQGSNEYREQKTIALRKELDYHYIDRDTRIKREDDSDDDVGSHGGTEHLTEEDRLKGYQEFCHEVGKPPGRTIEECIATLKDKPYVNIIDLIDARRMKKKFKTYVSFEAFKDYTMSTPGKRVDVRYARQDPFLAPLLQDFYSGPRRIGRDSAGKLMLKSNDECVPDRGVRHSGVICGRVQKVKKTPSRPSRSGLLSRGDFYHPIKAEGFRASILSTQEQIGSMPSHGSKYVF